MVQILRKYIYSDVIIRGKKKKKEVMVLFVCFQKVKFACRRVKACGVLHQYERPNRHQVTWFTAILLTRVRKNWSESIAEPLGHTQPHWQEVKENLMANSTWHKEFFLNASFLFCPKLFLKTWAEDQNFFYKKPSSLENYKPKQLT